MRQAYNGSATLLHAFVPVVHYDAQTPPVRVCLMECMVPMCRVGDLFMIEGQFVVTNDLPYSVEVVRKLIFSETPGAIDGDIITREGGQNVSPQMDPENNVWHGMHHGLFTFTGMFQISRVVPANCYLSVVMYAGGSSYTQPGDELKIEQSQGQIKWVRLNA